MQQHTIDIDPLCALREHTRLAHDALNASEAVQRLMSNTVHISDVQHFLGLLFRFYDGLEHTLGPALAEHPLYRQRSTALAHAIASGGGAVPGRKPFTRTIKHDETLLGMLYTIEGSSLGAVVIDRHLGKCLSTNSYPGSSYFRQFGSESRVHWIRVIEALRQQLITAPKLQHAKHGAMVVFEELLQIFEPASGFTPDDCLRSDHNTGTDHPALRPDTPRRRGFPAPQSQ